MKAVNGGEANARAGLFELANDLEDRVEEIADALDRLRETISALAELAPDR